MRTFGNVVRAVGLCIALVGGLFGSPLAAQPASLAGTVLSEATEKPVPNAEITFEGETVSARSDADGNFQITGITPGPHKVVVRSVGFEPLTSVMTFGLGQKLEVDLLIKPITTKLATVDVSAVADKRYASRLAAFEERRKLGMGRFLTSEVFEKSEARKLSEIVTSLVPGLSSIGQSGNNQVLASRRGGRSVTGNATACQLQIILNGTERMTSSRTFNINSINSGDIIALEYYTVSQTPPQFNFAGDSAMGGSQCGTMIVWTK